MRKVKPKSTHFVRYPTIFGIGLMFVGFPITTFSSSAIADPPNEERTEERTDPGRTRLLGRPRDPSPPSLDDRQNILSWALTVELADGGMASLSLQITKLSHANFHFLSNDPVALNNAIKTAIENEDCLNIDQTRTETRMLELFNALDASNSDPIIRVSIVQLSCEPRGGLGGFK